MLSGAILSRAMLRGAMLMLLMLCGCNANKTSNDAAVHSARTQAELGPVKAVVEATPACARLSDTLALKLTIDYQSGVSVEKPPFGDSIGGFLIRDFRDMPPKTSEGREIIEQLVTLEPTETGKLKIDPISIHFTDNRPDGDGQSHTLETEPLTIEITSVVADGAPSLAELRPAVGPIALPASPMFWFWALIALAAIAAVLAWWLWSRRRVKTEAAAIPLTAEESANRELDELLASGLAERDLKLFYVELTGIVRRYIERTTGIRAPEQTTEEFLREISRARTFGRDDSSRLQEFLEAADLVKFAAHKPMAEDVEESVRRARIFVGMCRTESAAASKEATA